MVRGKIKVTGKDRVEVLHRLLTQDIENLPAGGRCKAAFLSPQGKVLALMDVVKSEDHLVLEVEKDQVEKTIGILAKFVITEDAAFSDVTETETVPGTDLETHRIERGELRYGIDIDETIILNETGLETLAASETKGCYPGQEVVARIRTYGGLNRRIAGVVFLGSDPSKRGQTPLKRRDKIYKDEKEIGFITSACFSPTLGKAIALCYLQKPYFESEGLEVEVETKGGRIRGNVAKLPFIPLSPAK